MARKAVSHGHLKIDKDKEFGPGEEVKGLSKDDLKYYIEIGSVILVDEDGDPVEEENTTVSEEGGTGSVQEGNVQTGGNVDEGKKK